MMTGLVPIYFLGACAHYIKRHATAFRTESYIGRRYDMAPEGWWLSRYQLSVSLIYLLVGYITARTFSGVVD